MISIYLKRYYYIYCLFIVLLTPISFIVKIYCQSFCALFDTRDMIYANLYLISIKKSFIFLNLILKYPYKLSAHFLKCTGKVILQLVSESKRFLFHPTILRKLLILSGSVETTPGPINVTNQKLSFAVCNLDSISARNFNILPQIECFQSVYNFDIFGVCESSLTNQIPNEDIKLSGFSPLPFRFDKQDNVHNGGVYKENLPIKQRMDLQLLNETTVAEISLKRKKIFFIISYPSYRESKHLKKLIVEIISKKSK